jgi:hypothetical protein
METILTKSEIQDIILNELNLDLSIKPRQLQERYPHIPMRTFSGNFVALKRRNWVKEDVKVVIKNSEKRLKNLFDKFDNSHTFGGDNKIQAREVMCDWAIKSNVIGKCFSFSHINAELERLILKQEPKMSFVSVDRDTVIVRKLNKIVKKEKLPIETNRGEAYDVLRKLRPNSLAHAFLDFCGQLPSVGKEIKLVLDNDLVQVNGIVAITVSKTVRRVGKDYHYELWENLFNLSTNQTLDNRPNSDVANMNFIMLLMNERYTLREVFNYDDTSPMSLFILERLR